MYENICSHVKRNAPLHFPEAMSYLVILDKSEESRFGLLDYGRRAMGGRFVLMTQGWSLAERFKLQEIADLEPRYNIAPTQTVAIIRLHPETLERRLLLVKCGLNSLLG